MNNYIKLEEYEFLCREENKRLRIIDHHSHPNYPSFLELKDVESFPFNEDGEEVIVKAKYKHTYYQCNEHRIVCLFSLT